MFGKIATMLGFVQSSAISAEPEDVKGVANQAKTLSHFSGLLHQYATHLWESADLKLDREALSLGADVELAPMSKDEEQLSTHERFVMLQFRQLCINEDQLRRTLSSLDEDIDGPFSDCEALMLDASEEQDWMSLSLGFFAAHGIIGLRAHTLALYARYTCHYWTP